MNILTAFVLCWISLSAFISPATDPDRSRKEKMSKLVEKISDFKDFEFIIYELNPTVEDLTDYPVIFPLKREEYSNYSHSKYGRRLHPILKEFKKHKGIDIGGRINTPVYATGNGIVTKTGYDNGYGNYIEILHGGGIRSFYAHLNKTTVIPNDTVTIGQHIAYVGTTGMATGPHLHYEIRKGSRYLDPLDWCYFLMDYYLRISDQLVVEE